MTAPDTIPDTSLPTPLAPLTPTRWGAEARMALAALIAPTRPLYLVQRGARGCEGELTADLIQIRPLGGISYLTPLVVRGWRPTRTTEPLAWTGSGQARGLPGGGLRYRRGPEEGLELLNGPPAVLDATAAWLVRELTGLTTNDSPPTIFII
jgi:hypothetical protein